MKNLASLLALAAIFLGGCSKYKRDYSEYGHKWLEEPGLTKIVMKEDSITGDGMTVTPVRFEDARLVRNEEKKLVIVKAKGSHFFYLVIRNPTKNGMSVEYVVRQRRTELADSGEPKTEELDITTAQGMYPSSKVVRCSFDADSVDQVISNEYVKLLSVKRCQR